MIRDFLNYELTEFNGFNARTWFQQDGATCHTANVSLVAVRELFPQKLISKRGDITWPPRSPDLTPMDFFLWGYVKSKVYENSPRTLHQLKENIRATIGAIPQAMCRRVMTNFRSRLEECQRRQGRHLDDIIFHY